MDPQPHLRKPERPVQTPRAPSAHSPGALVLSERKKAEAWKIIALSVSVLSLGLALLILRAGRSEERIFVLDGAGNLAVGPLEFLADSRGFFHHTALYATNAALQRSPEGFDLYELLNFYFTPRAVQKLEEDWEVQKEDARRRNIQQKPLIDTVLEPLKAGEARLVEVRGRLVRAGAFSGQGFYEEAAFTLVFTFRRNGDLGRRAAYPWICDAYDLVVKEEGGG